MAATFAAAVVVGWACAQYPYLVCPDRTIFNSIGSENTVHDIVVASIAGALVLFPSLALLLYIFKDQKKVTSRLLVPKFDDNRPETIRLKSGNRILYIYAFCHGIDEGGR